MEATMLGVVLASIIVVAFTKWAVELLNWLWFRPRKLEQFLRKQGLNGNSYRPFLGDLKDFIKAMKAEQPRSIKLSDDIPRHIFPYHQTKLSKYGQNSFMWYGPWPGLNIADPELIKEILKKPDVFPKPSQDIVNILIGGLLSLDGEKWAKNRRIVNPAFHMEKLKNMVPAIGLSCSNMIHKLKCMVSSSDKGWCEIDIWPYLEDLSADMISRAAFGSSHEEGRRIFQLQRDKVKLAPQLFQFSVIPGWRHVPTKANRKARAIVDEMQSLLTGIIDKRLKAIERGDKIPSDDLLGIMLESNSGFIKEEANKNCGMSAEDIIEECKGFYFAGAETISNLMVWTVVLLCKHPEWQTRAREEVNRVFGTSLPTFDGLNQLRTMTMILQEVLRLYPPVPLTVRRVTEAVKLKNLIIPAGIHLTLLIGLLHYDPDIWGEDAKEFKPQRFSEGVSNAAKIQSSFIPFGSGPRVCIGQNFAMIEAKMFLAMILQRFSFELSPSYLHAPFAVVTLQPQYGATIILRHLESQSLS